MSEPSSDRLVAGRYRLRRQLGRGAMGVVWEAYDEFLRRRVAVKEVLRAPGLPEHEADELRERALREARAIAALSHPNVITLHDVAREHGEPFVVTEYLVAYSLAELSRALGPLAPPKAAAIGDAVAAGLAAAHQFGITHRDIKPGNVLVGANGQVKLTDFGIARNVSEKTMTRTGIMLGSPCYIAPEVAAGKPVTPAADLWGLGATLWAAVEGRPPYDSGAGVLETINEVVHGPVPRPSVTGPLADVIAALMVKDPDARISPAEVRNRLHPLLPPPSTPLLSQADLRRLDAAADPDGAGGTGGVGGVAGVGGTGHAAGAVGRPGDFVGSGGPGSAADADGPDRAAGPGSDPDGNAGPGGHPGPNGLGGAAGSAGPDGPTAPGGHVGPSNSATPGLTGPTGATGSAAIGSADPGTAGTSSIDSANDAPSTGETAPRGPSGSSPDNKPSLAPTPGPLPFTPQRPSRRIRRRGAVASVLLVVVSVLLFAAAAGGGFALARLVGGEPLLPPQQTPPPTSTTVPAPPSEGLTDRKGDAATVNGAQGGGYQVQVPADWVRFVEERKIDGLPSTRVYFVSPDGTRTLTIERFAGFYPDYRIDEYITDLSEQQNVAYAEMAQVPIKNIAGNAAEPAQQLTYRTTAAAGDLAPGDPRARNLNRVTFADLYPLGPDLWVVGVTVPVDQEDTGRRQLFDRLVPTFKVTG